MVKSQRKATKKQVCPELEAAGRQVSMSTVKCVLHQHELRGCPVRKESLIQKQHLKARLKFAADHMDKEKTFWRKTLRSQSCLTAMSSNMFGGEKVRSGSIMLWGCFTVSWSAALKKVNSIMKRDHYSSGKSAIIRRGLGLGCIWMF